MRFFTRDRVVLVWAAAVLAAALIRESRAPAAAPPRLESPRRFDTAEEDDGMRRASLWACGRNSLYMLCRLRDLSVNHQEAQDFVTVGERGSSLQELKEGAARLGLETEVYQWTMDDLRAAPLPVIAHLKRSPYEGNPTGSGHYVVVLSVTARGVHVLDGSFAYHETYALDRFEQRYWTGYVLAPVEPNLLSAWLGWLGLAAAGLALGWLTWPAGRTRPGPSSPAPAE